MKKGNEVNLFSKWNNINLNPMAQGIGGIQSNLNSLNLGSENNEFGEI